MLENGADVNAKGYSDWTALMHASNYGHKDVVELLIEKGADISAESTGGWTAMKVSNNEETRKVIINAIKEKNKKETSTFIGTIKSWFER